MLLTAFIAATLAWTGLSLALSVRQTAFVNRHRDAVPPDFAGSVSLEEHRKAADYTVAREQLARSMRCSGTVADAGLGAWAASVSCMAPLAARADPGLASASAWLS